jgi:hypothetical protein
MVVDDDWVEFWNIHSDEAMQEGDVLSLVFSFVANQVRALEVQVFAAEFSIVFHYKDWPVTLWKHFILTSFIENVIRILFYFFKSFLFTIFFLLY